MVEQDKTENNRGGEKDKKKLTKARTSKEGTAVEVTRQQMESKQALSSHPTNLDARP